MNLINVLLPARVSFNFLLLYTIVVLIGCDKSYSKSAKRKQVNLSDKSYYAALSKNTIPTKKLYLTFDDGPGKGTENVMKIAEDEKVSATFFIVGEHVFASRIQAHTWGKLKSAHFIQLCNHGYTHAWHDHYNTFYQNSFSVVNDFDRTKDSLGFTNSIIRTPGRNIWRAGDMKNTDMKSSKAAADSLQKAGFTLVGWDLEWNYNKGHDVTVSADSLVKEIDHLFAENRTRRADNLVLLAHDRTFANSSDSAQLRQLFQKLKLRKDYEMLWITSYPYIKENSLQLQARTLARK